MDQHESGVTAVVLGTMQDGGLPHIGCECPRCRAALAEPSLARYAASLAVIDRRREDTAVWIVDATPDIKWQLAMLSGELGPHTRRDGRLRQPDGFSLMPIWAILAVYRNSARKRWRSNICRFMLLRSC